MFWALSYTSFSLNPLRLINDTLTSSVLRSAPRVDELLDIASSRSRETLLKPSSSSLLEQDIFWEFASALKYPIPRLQHSYCISLGPKEKTTAKITPNLSARVSFLSRQQLPNVDLLLLCFLPSLSPLSPAMARPAPAPASDDDSDDMAVTMTHKVSSYPSSTRRRREEGEENKADPSSLPSCLLASRPVRSLREKRTPLLLHQQRHLLLLNINVRNSLNWIEQRRIRCFNPSRTKRSKVSSLSPSLSFLPSIFSCPIHRQRAHLYSSS